MKHSPHRTVGDHETPTARESSAQLKSNAVFGSRMQAAEAEAERFGDPEAAPPPPTAREAERDDVEAELALRSYTDSQPEPPAKEPLIDPLAEVGHFYN